MSASRIPPDVVFIGCAILMWLLSHFLTGLRFEMPMRGLISGAVLLSGLVVVFSAKASLAKHRTSGQPDIRVRSGITVLVTTGMYGFSRNPIYLGMAMLLVGWWGFLENWACILGVIAFTGLIDRYQIVPEEKVLQYVFGEDYKRYRSRVRRWL